MRRIAILLSMPLSLCGCSGDPAPTGTGTDNVAATAHPAPVFTDRAEELGIDFVHFNGMTGDYAIAEVMAPGGALFDYDNDGDLDLYLVQGNLLGPDKTVEDAVFPPPGDLPLRDRLLRNDLAETGRLGFTDVTEASGIEVTSYGMGVVAGDYDDDGDMDLYVTALGSNRFLRNEGDGRFQDVTLETGTDDPRWSAGAAFVDFDHDGRLDLFVCNYVDYRHAINKKCFTADGALDHCGPLSYEPLPDRLFRNLGDGRFEDVTTRSQIAREYGSGLGVVATDFNDDGKIDIYVANDAMPNRLWINQGDGTFRDDALLAGCAYNREGKAEASMGINAADFDGDGDDDLFMTHLREESNTLYINEGGGLFNDASLGSGLGAPSLGLTGFGTAAIDYDNDGWLDLLIANGAAHVIEELAQTGNPYPLQQTNQLFRNMGEGRFEEVTEHAGASFALLEIGRGVAAGDIDNDGDTDVLLMNNNGRARLLLNNVGQDNGWLGLRLVASEGGRDAYGARVGVRLDDGRELWRRVGSDGSYFSSNDPRVLVGLGVSGRVKSVQAAWPGGMHESWDWSDRNLNTYVTLVRGTGVAVP